MGRTVEELLTTISASELMQWMAYDRLSPMGDDRGDFQAGIVASTMANCHGAKLAPKDFMPLQHSAPTDEETRSREIAKAFGLDLGHTR